MKTYCFYTLFILFFLQSCTNKSENSNGANLSQIKQECIKDTTVNIPCIEPFTQITSIGNVDIEYTPGEYCLQVSGDPQLIDMVETSFDSGILTVGMRNETIVELSSIKSKQNIRLLVSSPELKSMSICGNGNFISNRLIKTDTFHAGNMGAGNIIIDSLECITLRFDNNNIGKAAFNDVNCISAIISTFGTTETIMSIKAEKDISLLSGGESKTAMDLQTEYAEIFTSNTCSGNYNVECTNLKVMAKEQSNLTFSGKYKYKDIKKDYGCHIIFL